MNEIYIPFKNKDALEYKFDQLALRDKRNFCYCPISKLDKYILLYWEESATETVMVIGSDQMKTPKKYSLPSQSEYYDQFALLYGMMKKDSVNKLQSNITKALTYKSNFYSVKSLEADKKHPAEYALKETKQKSNQAKCPRCGSISLTAQKQGFGIGKAVVGTALFGVIGGAVAGSMGAKKIEVTCLNCGKRFKI